MLDRAADFLASRGVASILAAMGDEEADEGDEEADEERSEMVGDGMEDEEWPRPLSMLLWMLMLLLLLLLLL